MADPRRFSDAELQGALRNLAPTFPYPPTPNLAAVVRTRIASPRVVPSRRRQLWRDPWRLALAAAVLLIVLGAAALINPPSRDAIAHFFHVEGVIVTRAPSPLPSLSPISPLDLGQRTTIEAAQSRVSFKIVVPPELGTPDAVYLQSGIPGGEVALAYKPRPGIPAVRETGLGVLVSEFRGDLNPDFLLKTIGPDTRLEETSVHGDAAWWLEGQPHEVIVKASPGTYQTETLRLASSTLIWSHNGVTYRIESGLSKADAMRIAAGLP
ncbi:MAG TPA: hypothetical protein VFR68_06665 [Candidatus Dormibacteraeota bacterium]|nr:hypothetical protein [Candidatus Dormibacteraeota bacterium]